MVSTGVAQVQVEHSTSVSVPIPDHGISIGASITMRIPRGEASTPDHAIKRQNPPPPPPPPSPSTEIVIPVMQIQTRTRTGASQACPYFCTGWEQVHDGMWHLCGPSAMLSRLFVFFAHACEAPLESLPRLPGKAVLRCSYKAWKSG